MKLTPEAIQAIVAGAMGTMTDGTLRACQNIRLTNSEAGFRATGNSIDVQISAGAPALEGGALDVAVSADRLTRILSTARGDLVLSLGEAQLTVRAGRSRFALPLFPIDDFPAMADDPKTGSIVLPGKLLQQAMGIVLPFAAVKDVRYYLLGMRIEASESGIDFIASDGHRMAWLHDSRAADAPIGATLPAKTLQKLKKLLESETLTVGIGQRVTIQSGPVTLDLPMIAGAYPDWQRLFGGAPEHFSRIKVSDGTTHLREAEILAESLPGGTFAQFGFQREGIRVEARGEEGANYETTIPASADAEVAVGFNVIYLREILSAFPEQAEVEIGFTDQIRAFQFRSDGLQGYRSVLMPARV